MAAAVEKAYLTIREGIVRGEYGPGEHLTAHNLASASGLSRTPVREAMRRLHVEGLIRFVPNRGAFVAYFDDGEVDKIYELRALLESHAAEAAAKYARDEQLDEIERLAREIEDLVEVRGASDVETISERNNRFHKLVVSAAANEKLETALSSIIEFPLVLQTFRRYRPSEFRRSARQHVELAQALRARDPQWAGCVMRSHILSARHTLPQQQAPSTNIPFP